MILRFASASLVVTTLLLSGCSTQRSGAAITDFSERKAYVTCAVTRAFLAPDDDISEEEVVLAAIEKCRSERKAMVARLNAEHPGNPAAVDGYMDELHATMLEHISLRLAQARRKALPDLTT